MKLRHRDVSVDMLRGRVAGCALTRAEPSRVSEALPWPVRRRGDARVGRSELFSSAILRWRVEVVVRQDQRLWVRRQCSTVQSMLMQDAHFTVPRSATAQSGLMLADAHSIVLEAGGLVETAWRTQSCGCSSVYLTRNTVRTLDCR
jgi:hypothetical protein